MTTELRNEILKYCKEVHWENPSDEDIQKISETLMFRRVAIGLEWNKLLNLIEPKLNKIGLSFWNKK